MDKPEQMMLFDVDPTIEPRSGYVATCMVVLEDAIPDEYHRIKVCTVMALRRNLKLTPPYPDVDQMIGMIGDKRKKICG